MIPYGRQSINEADIAAVTAVLEGDWLTTGPAVAEFESRLAAVGGAAGAVAVTSGTAALHVAYAAMGLGPGDEVITSPMTFVATQSTAIALGATVKFADVLPGVATIDPALAAAQITDKTKAIVAIDYAGQPAEMDELRQVADDAGVLLIEDAAHSIGSLYKGRPVGSLADLTTFSFFPTKNITTGEGGAVLADDPALLKAARRFRNHGLVREPEEFQFDEADIGPWHQEVHEFGLNYRLPDVLAALGTSQLTRLDEFKARRRDIFNAYGQLLESVPGLTLPECRDYNDPIWHLYPIRVDPHRRRAIFVALREAGIGVQVNYLPAHLHPVFARQGFKRGLCPVAEEFFACEISLPMYPGLTDTELDYVAEQVKRAIIESS